MVLLVACLRRRRLHFLVCHFLVCHFLVIQEVVFVVLLLPLGDWVWWQQVVVRVVVISLLLHLHLQAQTHPRVWLVSKVLVVFWDKPHLLNWSRRSQVCRPHGRSSFRTISRILREGTSEDDLTCLRRQPSLRRARTTSSRRVRKVGVCTNKLSLVHRRTCRHHHLLLPREGPRAGAISCC